MANTAVVRPKPTTSSHRVKLPSFDAIRLLCMLLVVVSTFGLPIPYFYVVEPFLNFATGTLFTLYGFLVLRDGADLKKNIKHTLKVFAILFCVYLPMTMGYLWFLYRNPFAYFTKRGIFNFIVLNFWGDSFCSSIWYVQSTLYALIICYLFRKLKKYDWLFCIGLFVGAILIGELAQVIHFSFLGNSYIPGNFLTRTIPYMLLGRLIRNHYPKIPKVIRKKPMILFLLGLLISVAEYCLLEMGGVLIYSAHLIGFIPMAMALCLYGVRHRHGGLLKPLAKYAGDMYPQIYYTYNPLGHLLLLCAVLFCKTREQYYYCNLYLGISVFLLTFCGFWLMSYYKKENRQARKNKTTPIVSISRRIISKIRRQKVAPLRPTTGNNRQLSFGERVKQWPQSVEKSWANLQKETLSLLSVIRGNIQGIRKQKVTPLRLTIEKNERLSIQKKIKRWVLSAKTKRDKPRSQSLRLLPLLWGKIQRLRKMKVSPLVLSAGNNHQQSRKKTVRQLVASMGRKNRKSRKKQAFRLTPIIWRKIQRLRKTTISPLIPKRRKRK